MSISLVCTILPDTLETSQIAVVPVCHTVTLSNVIDFAFLNQGIINDIHRKKISQRTYMIKIAEVFM